MKSMIRKGTHTYNPDCVPGNCFEDVVSMARTLRDEGKDPIIVHGFPKLQQKVDDHPEGSVYAHAWVEIQEGSIWLCLDPNGVAMMQEDYYALGRINKDQSGEYTLSEACSQMLKQEHFGPWQELPEGCI